MSNPYLIGLTGKRGSGKNTVGEFIKEWVEENELGQAQLQGFADSLKLSFARIFVPDATLEEALQFTDILKNHGSIKHDTILPPDIFHRFGARNVISGREALQHYGTEAHRDVFGFDFWIDQLLPSGYTQNESISDMDHPLWWDKWDDVEFMVVTDLRFENEAARIKELDGRIFEVVRPELNTQEDAHASEKSLDRKYIDEIIINDGTLEDLKETVNGTMAWYGPKSLAPENSELVAV